MCMSLAASNFCNVYGEQSTEAKHVNCFFDILKPHGRKLARESDGNVDYAQTVSIQNLETFSIAWIDALWLV